MTQHFVKYVSNRARDTTFNEALITWHVTQHSVRHIQACDTTFCEALTIHMMQYKVRYLSYRSCDIKVRELLQLLFMGYNIQWVLQLSFMGYNIQWVLQLRS
jgi:hypothetical protein